MSIGGVELTRNTNVPVVPAPDAAVLNVIVTVPSCVVVRIGRLGRIGIPADERSVMCYIISAMSTNLL